MSPVKILIIPGSLRSGSHNVRLAGAAMAELVEAGAEVSLISLADFPLPIYDGDLEARSGVPAEAVKLKRLIGIHHGVLLVSPEYNSSPPPLLKNALDWVTRVRERDEPLGHAMRGRPFALASASTGRFGGARRTGSHRLEQAVHELRAVAAAMIEPARSTCGAQLVTRQQRQELLGIADGSGDLAGAGVLAPEHDTGIERDVREAGLRQAGQNLENGISLHLQRPTQPGSTSVTQCCDLVASSRYSRVSYAAGGQTCAGWP